MQSVNAFKSKEVFQWCLNNYKSLPYLSLKKSSEDNGLNTQIYLPA